MRKQEIQNLEVQEKELKSTLMNLQRLIMLAEEKLEEAKKEAANIIESAKAKATEWIEKINIRLGLIPKKDIEDKRQELEKAYFDCEKYLTDDMRQAINKNNLTLLREQVHKMIVFGPDGTVSKWEPGYQEVSSFETKFKEYLDMKNRNVKTEDILKELEQPERVSGRKK